MQKSVPKALTDHQEALKSGTIETIQQAINDLQTEGFVVSKKLLLERTGFSNSLFSKGHVKDLLKKNGVCQFKNRQVIPRTANQDDIAAQLQSVLIAAQKKITLLEKQADDRKQYTGKLLGELEETKEEIKLLRGELFVFAEKSRIKT